MTRLQQPSIPYYENAAPGELQAKAHGLEVEAVRGVEGEIKEVGKTGQRLDRINALFTACNFITVQIFRVQGHTPASGEG